MRPSNVKVLEDLQRKKKGVTFSDYPTGFRLGARIFDLRESGYNIATIKENLGDCIRARYVLINARRGMESNT